MSDSSDPYTVELTHQQIATLVTLIKIKGEEYAFEAPELVATMFERDISPGQAERIRQGHRDALESVLHVFDKLDPEPEAPNPQTRH